MEAETTYQIGQKVTIRKPGKMHGRTGRIVEITPDHDQAGFGDMLTIDVSSHTYPARFPCLVPVFSDELED